jgi:branched-subunit amino acid aminotransferase/4-amino-4-deoxychorismate lyase
MMAYYNINGKIVTQDGTNLTPNNRAYLYGDGCFETIKVIQGKPINVENHVARILSGAEILKLRIPSYFSAHYFNVQIGELILKAGHKLGGRVRLSFDRSAGGTYMPATNEVSYTIEFTPDDSNGYVLNEKGLEVDIYNDIKKPINKLSTLKTKNGLIYVMASLDAQSKELDDMLILNEKRSIIESTSSNLFVVSNSVLYTPSLDEGVLAGTMRMTIINLALKAGIKVYECAIMPQNLLAADELLLTNAISGVKWVGGYRTKRYRNDMAKRLIQLLNDSVAN